MLRRGGELMGLQQDLFDKEPPPWELDDQGAQCVAAVVFSEFPFGPYDYAVPESLRAVMRAGLRVEVPLGRGNRTRVGYCVRIESESQHAGRLKPIAAVVDAEALLSRSMLELAEWMSSRYLCPLGQVLEAVIPAGVRGGAGTREQVFLRVAAAAVPRLAQGGLPVKQAAALRLLADSPVAMTPRELAQAAQCGPGPIQSLRKSPWVVEEVRRVAQGEFLQPRVARQEPLTLNPDQQRAFEAILNPLRAGRHETIVIHGVTGSGKTEVYIRAIEEVIGYGRQAIVLVPEISLTPQTLQRFRSRFDHVAVLHSHLTPSERHWHWRRIASGGIQVVVGARSAVFAPVPQLGLIVIDEEHDASFKQDTAPRYQAREVAVWRAGEEQVPLVLGSATPSLESWYEAEQGRYRWVDMPRRVSWRPLPDVATIDLRVPARARRGGGAISQPLYQAMRDALREGGQVILLLNRRGYSTIIQCPACGFVAKCPDCDIALTHHRPGDRAACHYCEHEIPAPARCPQCGFDDIRYSGLGTQKLEAEVQARFPQVPCLRMDSDSMAKRGSHERALDQFRSGDVKILLGTQMIAKGLDFPDVTLVGVINADTSLHFPDFRAAERTFQLVTQVAGRTGRGDGGGRVLVQTFSPDHPAILAAQRHDYALFVRQELPVRREFGYPPVTSLVRIVVRSQMEGAAEQFAQGLADALRQEAERRGWETRILGAAAAPMPKLRGFFRFHILLYHDQPGPLRELVRDTTEGWKTPDNVQWIVDVDPADML
jgi:primosomal protein N' (replication factor Y) (superfamily II helicase)